MEKRKFSKFDSKLVKIENLTIDVKQFTFTVPKDFNFIPGQFVTLGLKNTDEVIKRSYSMGSIVKNGTIELCIKIVENGKLTPKLDILKVGIEVEMLGPLGKFILEEESKDKNIIFVSTGTGIAPFRTMIQALFKAGDMHNILLIAGYRVEAGILYQDELREVEKVHKNFKHKVILSKPKTGKGGHVQVLVEKNFDPKAHYYICGLKEMVNGVKELLESKGIGEDQLFFERYS